MPLDPDFVTPIGRAAVARTGSDVTLVAHSFATVRALHVAERLAADHGIDAEVVDLRSLRPLDVETIADLGRQDPPRRLRRGGLADLRRQRRDRRPRPARLLRRPRRPRRARRHGRGAAALRQGARDSPPCPTRIASPPPPSPPSGSHRDRTPHGTRSPSPAPEDEPPPQSVPASAVATFAEAGPVPRSATLWRPAVCVRPIADD